MKGFNEYYRDNFRVASELDLDLREKHILLAFFIPKDLTPTVCRIQMILMLL